MPFVRIDLAAGRPPAHRRAIADLVHEALATTMKVPADDRFQVITEHAAEDLIFDPAYLGIQRSAAWVAVQVTLNEGRSVEQKKAFYAAVAEGLHQRLQFRREDVLISLVEVRKEDWSFGNGEAQYA